MLWSIPDAALTAGGFFIETRANAINQAIPAIVNCVLTGGYANIGDGGGGQYVRANGPLLDGSGFQSRDGAWWKLVGEVFNFFQFGAIGDGIENDTAAVKKAFIYADGKTIDTKTNSYLVTEQVVLPFNINVIGIGHFTLTGDEDHWFYSDTPNSVIWDNFNATITSSFASRTLLNRGILCETPNYFEVKNAFVTGASTAIHSRYGERFVCGNVYLSNVYGVNPQYGYGVNSSSVHITIGSVVAINDSPDHGRHAVYINGDIWQTCIIGHVYVKNWNRNPVQVVNTDEALYANCFITSAHFDTVNQAPTAITTGCIHVLDEATNTGIFVGTIKAHNTKGPVFTNLASGDAGSKVSNVNVSGLEQAAFAGTNLIYNRFGSNKQVGEVYCEALNVDWNSTIYFRDCTSSIFDQVFVGGSDGNAAVICVNAEVLVGNIQTESIEKLINSSSTLTYKEMLPKYTFAGNAPSSGDWNRGDIVYDNSPSAGEYFGWICVEGGSPGTWKLFGAIVP